MMENYQNWLKAIEQTFVVRFPKQSLATFGVTNIKYYVVTEPIYADGDEREGVVRTGQVTSERPAIITPNYFNSIQGFSSDAYEFFREVARDQGPNSPAIMYEYKNKPENLEIVGGLATEIAHNISKDLNSRQEEMSVVMVGVDELWDVALLKFIYEFTASSVSSNVQDFTSRGLLTPRNDLGGIPAAAAQQLEALFQEVEQGDRASVDILKQELDRWGVFPFYQDRFLSLFR
ncbi:MAG: hypothetical protein MK384_02500 [SAR202 cluster bacterium]|nr:hypothetical protein [SAR202 cluster bacterium]